MGPQTVIRPRAARELRRFEKFCDDLGIRHQGCLEATVYSNGSVTAAYEASRSFFMGIRVVHWLRPPKTR